MQNLVNIKMSTTFKDMAGRKKLNRTNLHARVAPETPDKLREIAGKMGYIYSDDGSIGQLFDAIALGEVILISTKKNIKSS
jgi:hypothetical protein